MATIQNDLDNWVNSNDKFLTTSESSTSLATSGSPWFEPLENIISSNSSSSVTSPDSNFLIDGNQNDIFLFDNKDFELSNDDDDIQVKKEEDEDDVNLVTLDSLNRSSSSGAKKQKKKAPRKRLTQNQKEAHNKIEKRYRININSKLARLQQIIPWVASEQSTLEVLEGNKNKCKNADDVDDSFGNFPITTPKLNKSMILEKAVDYILYMQNNERLFELEVHRLKAELGAVKKENEKLKQTNTA